jgi:hypothetical protein
VLENTTVEGESPVVENIYPALDSVPKYRDAGKPASMVPEYEGGSIQRCVWRLLVRRCGAPSQSEKPNALPEEKNSKHLDAGGR